MTRWARVQSTHRTKKQPEDATAWEDFQKQRSQVDHNVDDNQLEKAQKGIHRPADKTRQITDEERRRLRKDRQIKKMREEREKKGQVLLPLKIEKKIYRMKKAMRAKGKSADEIKQEIRQFRRKEELNYRKLCSTACLHCRKPGHKVVDCPMTPRVGICYKCGVSGHTSVNCLQAAGNGYKFAACFVCGEEGHISRECLKNPKGAYPKGGGCRFCGSNKHKKQECPETKKHRTRGEEQLDEVVVEVLRNTKQNVDQEDLLTTFAKASTSPAKSVLSVQTKAKLVKF